MSSSSLNCIKTHFGTFIDCCTNCMLMPIIFHLLQSVIRNEILYTSYSYPFFHLSMGLGTMFITTQLTRWFAPIVSLSLFICINFACVRACAHSSAPEFFKVSKNRIDSYVVLLGTNSIGNSGLKKARSQLCVNF